MIRSMTAFAREAHLEKWGEICWELRSVNHRFLDISTHLPEGFRGLEVIVRERIQHYVKRGKIDCLLRFKMEESVDIPLKINIVSAHQLQKAIQTIDTITGNKTSPNSLDFLRWPGILETNTLDTKEMSETVLQHLDTALTQLVAHREREGTQLARLIAQRCTAIADEVLKIRTALPTILQTLRGRLEARLAELKDLDHERLEQEVVFFSQKMDVAEELDRLEAHLEEMRKTLTQDKPVGRRMDFVIQELHREANTLGSKSASVETSLSAVELKVLIEQIREQVQNIE